LPLGFRAAGSAGASIDTGDAEKSRAASSAANGRNSREYACLLMPKNKVKLILNLCLIAAAAIPRAASSSHAQREEPARISVTPRAPMPSSPASCGLLTGRRINTPPAAGHSGLLCVLVAKAANMVLTVMAETDRVSIEAEPLIAEPAAVSEQG